MTQKTTINIKGMHCRSCEILLEKEIGIVYGVRHVRIHHKKGLGEIEYEGAFDLPAIEKAVIRAGYTLGKEDTRHFFSHDPMDYMELIAVACIIFILYAILYLFGVFNLNLRVSATPGLMGVLIIGLTAGISTCMALIGGLVLGISSRHAALHPEATTAQKFKPHIFFNIGRLVSYTVLGGVIGLLGSAFKLSSSLLGILTVLLGCTMFLLGLKLIALFPRLHNKSIALPKSISRCFGLHQETKEYSHRGSFITGALTFFVPCGFTQAMQLYAVSTGSMTQGALIMGVFALGTLPGILGIGGLTSAMKGTFARYFFKFAGLIVILLALFNIKSGLSLAGFDLRVSWPFEATYVVPNDTGGGSFRPQSSSGTARLENGVQIIEMVQAGNGYSPRQFTIKKDVPVIWNIKSTNPYSCAAYISMPSANIAQPLKGGDNVINFTPTKVGQMRFTCSMGMYSGVFNVIE